MVWNELRELDFRIGSSQTLNARVRVLNGASTGRAPTILKQIPIPRIAGAMLTLGIRRRVLQPESGPPAKYWFKCRRCHRIVSNYLHGFDHFLPCPFCDFFRRLELIEDHDDTVRSRVTSALTLDAVEATR